MRYLWFRGKPKNGLFTFSCQGFRALPMVSPQADDNDDAPFRGTSMLRLSQAFVNKTPFDCLSLRDQISSYRPRTSGIGDAVHPVTH